MTLILYFLFVYGAQEPSNYFAADVNDNSVIDLTDPLDLLKYALLGGVEPAAPFPNRGMDWTRWTAARLRKRTER